MWGDVVVYCWKMRVLGRGPDERTYAGFGRGHGALLVVIAVAGWPGSWVFCLRLSGCGRVVCIGGAIVGNGVVGVGDIAAVAADVAVLWRVCTLLDEGWGVFGGVVCGSWCRGLFLGWRSLAAY